MRGPKLLLLLLIFLKIYLLIKEGGPWEPEPPPVSVPGPNQTHACFMNSILQLINKLVLIESWK